MPASLIPAVWHHFMLNLLLQLFDGVLTYQVLSDGVPEANPLVQNAILQWGVVWGLLYWKSLACVLLFVIFALRHELQNLTLKAFTVTEAVYGSAAFLGLCGLLQHFNG